MILPADARAPPCTTFSPTPPHPKTAMLAPASTFARFTTAPTPVMTPQLMRQPTTRFVSSGTLTHASANAMVCSAKVGRMWYVGCPSSVILVTGTRGYVSHRAGLPSEQLRQYPHIGSSERMILSPGATLDTPGTDLSHDARALVAQHPGQAPRLHVAVDEVVVAVANARADHVEQHLALAGFLDFEISDGNARLWLFENCGSHGLLLRLLGVGVGDENAHGRRVPRGGDGVGRSRLGHDNVAP